MANHDENKDLKSFSRIGRVNYSDKTLRAAKGTVIGIKLLGKIDFLTKYCGWVFIWDNKATAGKIVTEKANDKQNARAAKKVKKEPKLTDKTKKNSKKK